MKLINQTKNTVLAEEAVVANTFFSRIKGLLGRREFNNGEALILKPCVSIHTFFMRFPIDVLFVGKDSKVIKATSSLKPSRITSIYFNATFAIELPAGIIQSTATCEGDLILLE